MFWNNFLSSEFSIMEITFSYITTIPKTPKIRKDNFDIFEECRVQEEKCRGTKRKKLSY